jgi:hypothetical protein
MWNGDAHAAFWSAGRCGLSLHREAKWEGTELQMMRRKREMEPAFCECAAGT